MNGIHPKLVFLMIGTNNGNPIEQVAVGVKAIIAQYRSLCPDAVILVQGIFPRSQNAADPVRERIKEIDKILATYADGKNILFLDLGGKFCAWKKDRQ